nr:putative nucleolar protein c2c4.08 [Quercus suber]
MTSSLSAPSALDRSRYVSRIHSCGIVMIRHFIRPRLSFSYSPRLTPRPQAIPWIHYDGSQSALRALCQQTPGEPTIARAVVIDTGQLPQVEETVQDPANPEPTMTRVREIQQMLNLVSSEERPILSASYRNPIFVCIDLEAFESAQDRITELGVSVLDTRDLIGTPDTLWLSKLRHAFYRPIEHARFVNRRFVKGCPEDFNFGSSTWIALSDAKRLLTRIFLDPTALSHAADFSHEIAAPEPKRNVIFVAHGASNDVAYLRNLGFDLTTDAPHVVKTVDTQSAAGGSKKHSIGLQRLLLALDLAAENLHNAGNDAAYTLQALVTMAVAEHKNPGVVAEELLRWKGKMPPAIYVKRPAPQVWAGSTTPVNGPAHTSIHARKYAFKSKALRSTGSRARKTVLRRAGAAVDGITITQAERDDATQRRET